MSYKHLCMTNYNTTHTYENTYVFTHVFIYIFNLNILYGYMRYNYTLNKTLSTGTYIHLLFNQMSYDYTWYSYCSFPDARCDPYLTRKTVYCYRIIIGHTLNM